MLRIVRGAGATAALVAAFAFGGRQARAASLELPDGSNHWLVGDDDGDEDIGPVIKEVEKGLNELLLVDESKQLRVRKDFREGLPMPAEQLERMLSGFVQVGADGKIHIKDPDQIRPYLPMIKGFLQRGGVDRLKKMKEELAKKSPEERKAALQKLMEQGRQFGMMPFAPDGGDRKKKGDDDDRRREEKRLQERRAQERKRAEEREREGPPPGPRGGPSAGPRAIEERLTRLENRVDKLAHAIERLLDERGGGESRPAPGPQRRFQFVFPPQRGEPGERGERGGRGDGWQREPWGMRGEPGPGRPRAQERGRREERDERDERRAGPRPFDFFRGGDPEQLRQHLDDLFRNLEQHFRELRDRFERGDRGRDEERGQREEREERGRGERRERRMDRDRRGRDRDEDEDDDDGDRGGFSLRGQAGELRDSARDVIQGLRKLSTMLEPQDYQLFVRVAEGLAKNLGPEDLQDMNPGKLMLKVQESVDPQDVGRLMEIFSQFIATPEGRALAKRLEGLGAQLPKLAPPAPRRESRRTADERTTAHGLARLY